MSSLQPPRAVHWCLVGFSERATHARAPEPRNRLGRMRRSLTETGEAGALRALRAPYLSEDRKNPRSGRKKTGLRQRAPRCAFERAPVLGMRHHHGARVLLGGVRPARLP